MAARSGYDLLSVGDTTTDVFLEISDASVVCQLKKEECLLCIEYADKVPVDRMTEILGVGNAANNAVGSARLGVRTALWTILGNDALGKRTKDEVFRPEGVDTRYVEFDKKRGTNFSTVINFQKERTILVYHQHRTYRFPRVQPAPWMYLTSMGEGWESIIPALTAYLGKTGARLAFNPGTYQLKSSPRALRTIFAVTDILFVNRDESHRILGVDSGSPQELLNGLRKLGPKTAVVTDGPDGAYAASEEGAWFVPTTSAPVIERTGAGDSFGTGVVAAVIQGKPLTEALRWGTVNASSVIQYVGAREGLLTRAGMRRLLKKYADVTARPL